MKRMDQVEWMAFEQAYELVFQMLGGINDVALFGALLPGSDETLALIPSNRAAVVEAASPGDWYDTDETSGHGWRLVAGHADAASTFGIVLEATPPRLSRGPASSGRTPARPER